MPTARNAKAAAADTAEEAQQPEEPVADPGSSQAQRTLDMIRSAVDVMKGQIRSEFAPDIRDIKATVGNLEGLVAALTEAGQRTSDADDDAVPALAKGLADLREGINEHLERQSKLIGALNDRQHDLAARVSEMDTLPTSNPGPARPGLGAARKVLAVMRLVDEIGKNRDADMGDAGQYSFRGVDDAMNAVGAAVRRVGLIMRQEVLNSEHSSYMVDKASRDGRVYGKTQWTTTRVTMRYVFLDPDDGSEHAVEGYGVGKDSGDKDGSKAMAAAMKYALFQGLCIPVKGMNIDPEDDHPDSGSERYAPEPEPEPARVPAQRDEPSQAPPPERTPGEVATHLLTWALRKTGLTQRELGEQVNEADARGLLEQHVINPQTGHEGSLREHLNAIMHTLPEG